MGRGPEKHDDDADEEVGHDADEDDEGKQDEAKDDENVDELLPPQRRAPRERLGRSLPWLSPSYYNITYSPIWCRLSIINKHHGFPSS